jgi:hypothetical protein
VFLTHLQRNELAIRWERPRQPDAAIARQRPDLQDAPRATRRRKDLQQLPLQRRDLDRRHAMLLRRLDGKLQRLILRREHSLQTLLDLGAVFRAGQNLLIAHDNLPVLRQIIW